ncbi:mannose-1-phosphate guanylyltransferase/mannose-6-phosphate isomerase [Terasakiella brassicae]|uniref:mannose-1-phosphate guanylyltransferase n=1 Tax=Terasakiella brassicae TaxID=1634917 RepID=A0A917C703_9PROT|nr:mannose-1-phosphate guanylyltransferase/mannose-6-phosphate isomerase [Terasakiella brassicae]
MTLQDGENLLQKTYANHGLVSDTLGVLTVTNREFFFETKELLAKSRINYPHTPFILENEGRDTAPAILAATLYAKTFFDPETVLFVTPSDHLIEKHDLFVGSIKQARSLAEEGRVVTFGIKPTSPETGFGYIEHEGTDVIRFVEKPDVQTAEEYLRSGRFLWNSGMFCFRADVMIDEFRKYHPDMLSAMEDCMSSCSSKENKNAPFFELPDEKFSKAESISFDYAIMENTKLTSVVPCEFSWSDIGSWTAMGELVEADENGNRTEGNVRIHSGNNNYIRGEDRLIAAIGLEDIIAVDTSDALLLAHKDAVQDVKAVYKQLEKENHPASQAHTTVYRPWGSYTVLQESESFKIKRIEVHPKASLSLQKHYHRSEHWIVVSGSALVVNGDQEMTLNANQSTYIPAGQVHRIENPGILPLKLIEVQCGEYLGEDDIVRFEDKYGRDC